MKSTDLRIGNLVKTNVGQIASIFEIRENQCRIKQDDGHIAFIDYERLTPISLTEELLLQIGAIKLGLKPFPSFNLYTMQINFIDGVWLDYVTRVEIKGLHHLQNIFYFAKDKELDLTILKNKTNEKPT